MTDQQPEPKPQIIIDERGGLHFNGSTDELHSYIDRLNETVAKMNAQWERYLNPQELSRVAEIREWWKEDSAGAVELNPDGWPPPNGFPEIGTQAFQYMSEISDFHRIAERRMIDEAELRERECESEIASPPTPAH
jgi:hypothetical protein